MADRRRRIATSESEEEEKEEKKVVKKNAAGETVEETEQSDYESAAEDQESEEEETDDDSETEEETDDEEDDDEEEEEEGEEGEEYDDQDVIVEGSFDEGWVEEERQSGDGQEQPDENKEKALDDDEDKKNPAYIPRKGAFYEHDLRLGEEAVPIPPEPEQESRPKKKLWKENDKWLHDRYIEESQAPKSREELIAIYGYDIRAYDRPPDVPKRTNRPRREPKEEQELGDFIPQDTNYSRGGRRGGGRGGRGRGGGRGGRGGKQWNDYGEKRYNRGRENFPPSPESQTVSDLQSAEENATKLEQRMNSQANEQWPKESGGQRAKSEPRTRSPNNNRPKQWTNTNYRNNQEKKQQKSEKVERDTRSASPSKDNEIQVETLVIEKKSYSRERRVRSVGKTRVQDGNISTTFEKKLSLKEEGQGDGETPAKEAGPAETATTEDKAKQKQDSRPKRYSSQRQRNAPDVPYEQMPYYGQGKMGPMPGYPQPVYHPGGPATGQMMQPMAYQVPPVSIVSSGTGQVPNPPRIFTQPPTAMTVTAAQGNPNMLPPQPTQYAPMMAYPQAPPYHQLVGQMPVPIANPMAVPTTQTPTVMTQAQHQDIYSRGGTMYFNPEVQQISPNRSPARRPKAAIPIINPQDIHPDDNQLQELVNEEVISSNSQITIVGEAVETSV